MNSLERDVAPCDIPAAWASSLTEEVWQEILERNRKTAAAPFFGHLRHWFHFNWKAIAFAVVFWALCLFVYVELVTH